MGVKRCITVSCVLLVAIYASVSVMASTSIGRHRPGLASLFHPPLFNFVHTYVDGNVMDFTIGMTRSDLIKVIANNKYTVDLSCWGDLRAGGASLYTADQITEMVLKQDV